jgi:hypothetical protein
VRVTEAWKRLRPGYDAIVARHPRLRRGADVEQQVRAGAWHVEVGAG